MYLKTKFMTDSVAARHSLLSFSVKLLRRLSVARWGASIIGCRDIRQSICDTPVNRLKQPQKVFTMTAICHIFHNV